MDWVPVLAFGALTAVAVLFAVMFWRFGPRSTALTQAACAVALCLVAVNVTVTEWREAHPQPVSAEEKLPYDENRGPRDPAEMSPSSERAARAEAERIEPVLARMWAKGTWDVVSVREALFELGYRQQQFTDDGRYGSGNLIVKEIHRRGSLSGSRPATGRADTSAGSVIGLRVRPDACVSAFVQRTDYEVRVTGPYPESGCFEPPFAH
ncbi:hypothetical protein H9Y04_19640 [Streptomyces sp. TRM66268-LWL]|uniref:DUF6234 domain-containing protein n=2 Tax=Streptomyces polyasparticus TaxID=2767826 RepID=A0ABR7SHP9_9ACTN|nr:hypothetical protein [Streptomyces polyasparticus]